MIYQLGDKYLELGYDSKEISGDGTVFSINIYQWRCKGKIQLNYFITFV